jgi:hypothetical protein
MFNEVNFTGRSGNDDLEIMQHNEPEKCGLTKSTSSLWMRAIKSRGFLAPFKSVAIGRDDLERQVPALQLITL